MRSQVIKTLKEELKELAKEIKSGKIDFKEAQRALSKEWNNTNYWDMDKKNPYMKSYHFRHKHIVYCLVRGRTMEEIECPKHGNLPDKRYIDKFKEEVETALKKEKEEYETLYPCAA